MLKIPEKFSPKFKNIIPSSSTVPTMSIPSKLLPLPYCPPNPNTSPKFRFLNPKRPLYCQPKTLQIQCAKRTGKQRYPSEKKKLKLKHKALTHVNDKFQGIWRLSKLGVPLHLDPGKDFLDVSEGLLQEIAKVLKFPVMSCLGTKKFEEKKRNQVFFFFFFFLNCVFFFFCFWCGCWKCEKNQTGFFFVCIFMGCL